MSGQPLFHADEFPACAPDQAFFHVIPCPFEASVSYGGGTADGPAAILAASAQLEANVGRRLPGSRGIYTAPAIDCSGSPEDVLFRIEAATAKALALGAVPVLLGGEHTVSLGAFRACAKLDRPVGLIQFDAHADLRDTYEDSPYSHACVMRRALDLGLPIFQIGVRVPSVEELDCRDAHPGRIRHLDARAVWERGIPDPLLPPDFPEDIYVTFDVDGLDPSIMPATGTPVPGGLTWREAILALERACTGRRLVGCDVVELAPRPHDHASDFAAAHLTYTLMDLAAAR
ncbi:agmatinase [Desulfovibrio sp. X2]|uniref:agmatinase n=1 Tax=Desulfovibrio sp. X2 TaxID=941449 RepID=UPI000358AEB7|nr:agmatinase [Desulfovibrio sp. X2]EPR44700.1 agmatinase [Desulfovibrio sp. X2]